jgi:membrane protease YdiL (CAAX protease family)
MTLFVATVALSDAIALVVDPDRGPAAMAAKLVVLALSAFLVVPGLLRLPTGSTTIAGFPGDAGLSRIRPLGRNMLLLLCIYATFAASQTAGQWVNHEVMGGPFDIDPGRHSLFGADAPIQAVFEEIFMRGVMLAYLLTRYSKGRAVLVSSAVFAGIHLLNMLNPASNPVWVLAQVVWAFAIGVMYAEIFVRTRSLYLPILIHYLVNGTVGVWFYGLDGGGLTDALLGVPFYGVIPALLGLTWLRLLRNAK